MRRSLLSLIAFVAIACGEKIENPNNEQEQQKPNSVIISLEKQHVTIYCRESASIKIGGTEDYCSATAEDDFVAWATGGNNTIEIEAQHVGITRIIVECAKAENKDTCVVTVLPTFDYVGNITSLWGYSLKEVYDQTDRTNLLKSYYNEQRGCQTFSYQVGEYYIVTMYYFSDNKLYGIHKTVEAPNDTETDAYINISNSLNEYMEFVSGSSSSGRIYKHPLGYYAVLYSPSLNKTFDIYYATTLEEAKNHTFTK